MTEELRAAAAEVIQNSSRRRELNAIVDEAISCSDVFDEIASRIEDEAYDIIVGLDFSACTQLRGGSVTPAIQSRKPRDDKPTPDYSLYPNNFSGAGGPPDSHGVQK